MGTRITPVKAPLVGFGIPDKRLTFAASTATPTQAGPKPGTATADSPNAKLEPRLSGGQDTDLEIYASRAGSPLRSPTASRGAAVVFSGDAGTTWNGWTAPPWMARQEVLTPWSSVDSYSYMDAVTIPTNQKVVAVFQRIGNVNPPEARVFDPETGDFAAAVNIKTNPGIEQYSDCALGILPNERLLFIQAFDDGAGGGTKEFWNVHYSDDDGTTWALASNRPFRFVDPLLGTPTVSGVSALTCRIVSDKQGNVLFVRQVNDGAGKAVQYASSNAGMNFTKVSSTWTTNAPIHINLFLMRTGELALVSREGASVVFRKIGSVFEPLEGAPSVTIAGFPADAVSAWPEPDGTLWATIAIGGLVRIYYSTDDGATWVEADSSFPSIYYNDGDSGTKYLPQAAATTIGSTWLLGNAVDDGGGTTYDGMVFATQAGGFSNVEVPPVFDNSNDLGRQWLPIELPDTNSALALTTTGGTAVLASPGMMRITTTAQTYRWADAAPGTTWGTTLHDFEGIVDIKVQSGGSLVAGQCAVSIFNADGVNGGIGALVFSTSGGATTYAVLDNTTSRGSVAPGVTGRLQVRYYYDAFNSTFSTWWRAHNSRIWTQGHAAVTITPFAAPAAATSVTWGHTTGTCQSDWYMHNYAWTTDTGSWDPPDSLADYRGKSFTTIPYPIPDIGPPERVAHLALKGGPAFLADTFDIKTSYDYGIERVYPTEHPSPEARYRSTDTSDTEVARWSPNEDAVLETSLGNGSLFLYFEGINFRTAVLEGSKDGGATFPFLIGTLDSQIGQNIPIVYIGEDAIEVNPASSGSHTRYLWFGELVGGTVEINSIEYRRIRKNTEGVFNADATTRQARIWFRGGAAPAPVEARILAPRAVLVVHDVDNAGPFDTYRVRIPSQNTADGYFEIGNMLVGAVHPVGRAWEYGFVVDYQPNSESQTDRALVNRIRRNGKVKRSQTFGWPSPLDMTEFRKASPNPNYLAADTGNPLAAEDDVPFWLAGVLEEIGSGETPVVAFWNIPLTDGTVTDDTLFMGATMSGSVGAEHVTGKEGEAELYRGSRITVVEL